MPQIAQKTTLLWLTRTKIDNLDLKRAAIALWLKKYEVEKNHFSGFCCNGQVK